MRPQGREGEESTAENKVRAVFAIQVNAPPERVYDYLVDFGRHPEWSPDGMIIQGPSGPASVGNTYKAEGTLQGKRNASTVEVKALERPRRIVFAATDKRGPVTHEFRLTPKDGGTYVERDFSGANPSFAQKLMFAIFLPIAIRPNFMKALGMMKANLEKAKS